MRVTDKADGAIECVTALPTEQTSGPTTPLVSNPQPTASNYLVAPTGSDPHGWHYMLKMDPYLDGTYWELYKDLFLDQEAIRSCHGGPGAAPAAAGPWTSWIVATSTQFEGAPVGIPAKNSPATAAPSTPAQPIAPPAITTATTARPAAPPAESQDSKAPPIPGSSQIRGSVQGGKSEDVSPPRTSVDVGANGGPLRTTTTSDVGGTRTSRPFTSGSAAREKLANTSLALSLIFVVFQII